jgi:hypothetical protein
MIRHLESLANGTKASIIKRINEINDEIEESFEKLGIKT